MPNHITNVVTMRAPEDSRMAFEKLHFKSVDGTEVFDFATIIPRPDVVSDTEASNVAEIGFYALTGMIPTKFPSLARSPFEYHAAKGWNQTPVSDHYDFREWLEEHDPECLEKGRKLVACFRETGHLNWYDWSIANWGTKWDAYDFKIRSRDDGKLVFQFDTAWSPPRPVFLKLAELYPEASFDIVSIDEGGPEYEGHFSAKRKEMSEVPSNADRYRFVYGRDPYVEGED